MEMNSRRKYNLRSLPGERRGASGADARCHSMRTIGGEVLSRRTLTENSVTAGRCELNRRVHNVEATADPIGDDTSSIFSSIPSTGPSYMTRRTARSSTTSTLDSVVQDAHLDTELAPTTNAKRTRRRWTPEMNKFILRTYLQLTALDTDRRTYLEPLHLKFIEKYPNMQISRQRVGDQRRAIIRNKLLPQITIDEIHNEVKKELNQLQYNHQYPQTLINQTQQLLTPTQTTQIHPTTSETLITQQRTNTRMRWTSEQNEAIMRSYYRVTDLGRNETAYRKPFYDDFIKSFPSLAHLSEQRIADQRRAIINNKYIETDKLNSLRSEIAAELQLNNLNLSNNTIEMTIDNSRNNNTQLTDNNDLYIRDEPPPNVQIHNTETNIIEELLPNSQTFLERVPLIDDTFQQAFQFYVETSPINRIYIPKQKPSKKLSSIINYLNKIIFPENVNKDTDFHTIQTVIYSAAWTAAKVNGAKISLLAKEIIQGQTKEFNQIGKDD